MVALHVTDLSKRYTRGAEAFTALNKVSFSIQPGELVARTGPSGSGKSTLLNIIAGYDQADNGSVVVNGFDVTRAKPAQMDALRTRTVGFIFQQFHLVPGLNAVENVELSLLNTGLSKAERRARAT